MWFDNIEKHRSHLLVSLFSVNEDLIKVLKDKNLTDIISFSMNNKINDNNEELFKKCRIFNFELLILTHYRRNIRPSDDAIVLFVDVRDLFGRITKQVVDDLYKKFESFGCDIKAFNTENRVERFDKSNNLSPAAEFHIHASMEYFQKFVGLRSKVCLTVFYDYRSNSQYNIIRVAREYERKFSVDACKFVDAMLSALADAGNDLYSGDAYTNQFSFFSVVGGWDSFKEYCQILANVLGKVDCCGYYVGCHDMGVHRFTKVAEDRAACLKPLYARDLFYEHSNLCHGGQTCGKMGSSTDVGFPYINK